MVPTLSSHVDNVLDSIANLTIDTSRRAPKRDHGPRHSANPHATSTNVAGPVSRQSYPAFDHDSHLSLLADTILRDPSQGFDVSVPRGAPLAPRPYGSESSPEEDIQTQDSGLPSPEDPDKTPTRSSFVRVPASATDKESSLRLPIEWIAHYLIEGLLDGDYQDPAARPALFQVHHYLVAFFQAHCQYYELRVPTSFLALCYLEMLFDQIYMSHLRFKSPCHKAQAVFSIFCVFYVVASKWNDDDARTHVRTLTQTKAFAQDHRHAKALENQALQVLLYNTTINTSMWVGWLRYLGETNNDRITGDELTFPLECIKPCQATILALFQRTSECPPGPFSRPIDEGALAALVKALCMDLVKVRRV